MYVLLPSLIYVALDRKNSCGVMCTLETSRAAPKVSTSSAALSLSPTTVFSRQYQS